MDALHQAGCPGPDELPSQDPLAAGQRWADVHHRAENLRVWAPVGLPRHQEGVARVGQPRVLARVSASVLTPVGSSRDCD
jgi:hypothetical protein